MRITELILNGINADMYADTFISFTSQVNDISEVKDRQASFTDSFSIPKTPKNVSLLKGLGIASDISDIPYTKPDCRYSENRKNKNKQTYKKSKEDRNSKNSNKWDFFGAAGNRNKIKKEIRTKGSTAGFNRWEYIGKHSRDSSYIYTESRTGERDCRDNMGKDNSWIFRI